MALLDIDKVKSQFPGQDRGIHEGILHPAEIGIGQHRVVRSDRDLALFIDEGDRVGGGIVEGDQRFSVTVTARVGQLQADDQVVITAVDCPVRLAGLREQRFEGRGVAIVHPELPGIRPGFFRHGRGLAPDELCSALAEQAPSPEDQFIRRAIQVPITTFHGVHGHGVADGPLAEPNGPPEGIQILSQRDIVVQAKAVDILLQIVE